LRGQAKWGCVKGEEINACTRTDVEKKEVGKKQEILTKANKTLEARPGTKASGKGS